MKIATWNINGVKARIAELEALARESSGPTSSACRRSSRSTRAFPARRVEALGYNVRRARPEGLQRRRDPLEARRSRTCARGLPGDDEDDAGALHRGRRPTGRRRRPRRLDLPAQRQSDRHRQVRLQAALDGPAARPTPQTLLALRGAAGARRRLQRHPRRRSTRTTPDAWADDALFQPETRAGFATLANLGLTDAIRACQRQARRLHLLGLSGRRLAEEQRHPHRPPAAVAASRRPARRRRRRQGAPAARRSRRTTRRSGSSWTSDKRPERAAYPRISRPEAARLLGTTPRHPPRRPALLVDISGRRASSRASVRPFQPTNGMPTMMGNRHFGATFIALGLAGCAQAPTLASLTTGSILPALPSPASLLPATSANGTPRPPERVSGNLYRVFATDRKLQDLEQRANYALLRAAESTRQMGGTHFIIVDTYEGTIPKNAGPAKLGPSGGLIRIFRATPTPRLQPARSQSTRSSRSTARRSVGRPNLP